MNGMEVRGWALMDLARLTDHEYNEIVSKFETIGKEVGNLFFHDVLIPVFLSNILITDEEKR